MKRLITAILILLTSIRLDAQTQLLPDGLTVEKYTNEFLDTLNVKKNLVINDYSMFGVTYGVNLSRVTWNPRQNQDLLLIPMNIGISYTKYGKMFGKRQRVRRQRHKAYFFEIEPVPTSYRLLVHIGRFRSSRCHQALQE